MGKLEKIIYLADHIEEGRRFAGVNKIRALAFRDLDRAIEESTSKMLLYLLKKKLPIYPGTIETRNRFLFGNRK
jgi:HD superfamily phosphohydrolase YqeK